MTFVRSIVLSGISIRLMRVRVRSAAEQVRKGAADSNKLDQPFLKTVTEKPKPLMYKKNPVGRDPGVNIAILVLREVLNFTNQHRSPASGGARPAVVSGLTLD